MEEGLKGIGGVGSGLGLGGEGCGEWGGGE